MTTINIDKAIQDTETFKLKLAAAAGYVGEHCARRTSSRSSASSRTRRG